MSNGPPYSENHEAAVLGRILMQPGVLGDGLALEDGDFHILKHQQIFRSMLTLNQEGIPADATNVVQHLAEKGTLEDVGGGYFITGLPDLASISIKADARKLRELAERRGVREQAIKVQQGIEAGLPLYEISGAESFIRDMKRESVLTTIMPQPLDIWCIDEIQEERPEDMIEGILPVETVLMLYGLPKVGKSLLGLGLGFHLAAGVPWFDLEIKRRWRVLYISGEGGRWSLIDRLNRLLKGDVIPPAKQFAFWAIPSIDILDAVDFGGLVAGIESFAPDIIIMDPLQKFHRCDENDNTAMQSVMDSFRSLITAKGRSLIIQHHARKAGDATRGASSVSAEVDTIVRFEWVSKNDHHGARRLYFEDLRHGEAPDDLFLHLDPFTLSFTRESFSSSNEAVQVLAEHEGRMESRAALKDALISSSRKEKAWAYRRIQLAIQSGQIEESESGGEIRLRSL